MNTTGSSQFALLKTRRFLPLFVTQAISAFNDNFFRFSISTLFITNLGEDKGGLLNTVSAGLFILPFFLFSGFAGQLSDKFDKALVARRIKFIEIFIVALSAFALFTSHTYLQQFCIFLAGAQAAFFGPIKYAILPQHLTKQELLGGNGMVEMATFLAVLLGTIFGAIAINLDNGAKLVSAIMVALALLSYWTTTQIPTAPPAEPDMKLNWNMLGETWNVVRAAATRQPVFQAIIGVSWFWVLGVVFVTQIPKFNKETLLGTDTLASSVFALFSVGIALGSIFCNRLLKGKVTLQYLPIATLLMSLFMIDMYFAAGKANTFAIPGQATTLLTMLGALHGFRLLFDLTAVAFFAGLYVVPLFATMQARTPYYLRARTIGANNIVNAVFMLAATAVSLGLLTFGFTAKGLFLCLGLANLLAAVYIMRLLPHATVAGFVRSIFRLLYRVEVRGLENLQSAGPKALVIANHTSFLDGPLLSAFLPEKAGFAINSQMAKRWWVKPAFTLVDLCPIDPTSPMALRSLVEHLKKGKRVVIFPEGRITVTGGLMKIYEGPGAVADMANAKILPVRIDGAQRTPFSRVKGLFPTQLFPKITITYLPPVRPEKDQTLRGAALREHQAEKLYDIMTDMVFRSSKIDQTLWQAMLDARKLHGGKTIIYEDITRTPMDYDRLLLGSMILGKKLAELTPSQKYVGVLLPNANAAPVTIFGLHAHGRIPAMLNFSTGAVNMSAACTAAEVRTIITSRKFIETAEMQDDVALLERNCKIVYLEDVRESISRLDKISGLLSRILISSSLKNRGAATDPRSPAVVLFTSGSEGVPKGVVLSHRNIIANCQQINARIAFTPRDVFFTALPVFHAFGFTGGIVLTALLGVRSFLYPSPLHYKIVPEMVYDTDATVLLATDTFLTGYARNAHPYDFYNMKLVVGGAERVKPETRALWSEKFGIRITEGYGATECSPVIAANTPMHSRYGTVGRIFDGMEYRLEPVEGITEGGRLIIKGPNIMLGYLRADNPGVLEPPPDGWYDTGDIVTVDERRFVTILGRAKRFSKIAGEMVSLTAIEMKLQQLYPDNSFGVVGAPDPKKGEQLICYTTLAKPDRKEIATGLKGLGCTELMIPKIYEHMPELPVLGTGKTDYIGLGRMAREKVEG